MKTRLGFVSNSSSSSCVIWNWGELPGDKKDKVLRYQEAVKNYWKGMGWDIHEDSDGFVEPYSEGLPMESFGSVGRNSVWYMEEKCHGQALYLYTNMDNFDMLEWLQHLGGIDYQYTGE